MSRRTGIRLALWRAGMPMRLVLLGGIRLYRLTLGHVVGGHCRFHPTCSTYAEAAVATLGATRGGALALWRVLRCSPLSRGGVDHPPRPGFKPRSSDDVIPRGGQLAAAGVLTGSGSHQ